MKRTVFAALCLSLALFAAKFDKEHGTFELASGQDSTQGTYTAEPFTMLDMRLYEDDFESDGYEVLLPVKFLDESNFTTPVGEIYKKAGR